MTGSESRVYEDRLGNEYMIRAGLQKGRVTIFKRKAGAGGWHVYNRRGQWFSNLAEANACIEEKARKLKWRIKE